MPCLGYKKTNDSRKGKAFYVGNEITCRVLQEKSVRGLEGKKKKLIGDLIREDRGVF